nr:unnamed protein product [Leishmania braziliensis]
MPSRAAAARTIQVWLRRRRELQYAHRLLLCLHVVKVLRSPDQLHCSDSVNPLVFLALGGVTSSSSCSVEHGAPVEESLFTRLYETVVEYESALRLENYTRQLLFEEYCATSDAARLASQTMRHMLQQRHPALRPLSLSVEVMQQAVAGFTSAPQLTADSTMTAAEKLQAYLSPAHFAWWRTSQVPSIVSASVPTAAPLHTNGMVSNVRPQPPLPLRIEHSNTHAAESPQGERWEPVYMEVDDQEEETSNYEVAVNAAYTREREAAESAALLAAQQATMAGCPTGFTAHDGRQPADVSLYSASSTFLPEEDDISLVVQPVLGCVAQRCCHSVHEYLDAEPSLMPSPVMVTKSQVGRETTTQVCAVCELDGVVASPYSNCGKAAERWEEDMLHPCDTCGALVHLCCAYSGPTADTHFCCGHCCSGGGTA